jgi:hypothetical protein
MPDDEQTRFSNKLCQTRRKFVKQRTRLAQRRDVFFGRMSYCLPLSGMLEKAHVSDRSENAVEINGVM